VNVHIYIYVYCVGRYLAVASEDSMIDLYDCVSDYDFLTALQVSG